jgi:uncharacterized protein (TIGR02001 family)
MKVFFCECVLAALVSPLAMAAEAGPQAVTANVSLTTKYKYRGLDQADPRMLAPAIQGGFDFSKNGFYIGNWNSSVGTSVGSEIDLYGGYKGNFSKDFGYDLGLLQYVYAGSTAANTTELYGALSYDIFSLKYSITASKDYFGFGKPENKKGRGTSYFDFSVNYEVVKNLTLNGHLGFTILTSGLRVSELGYKNYLDYKIGATYDLGSGFAVSGAIVGANQKNAYKFSGTEKSLAKDRLILSLTKTM